ncbi:MAG: type IV pilus modification protein PilV [Gammaproteobacteria bacterium]|jgi:type IV pilus assembly protein PilV
MSDRTTTRLRRTAAPPRLSRGFTLIEVLVALVVLAIGLLGLAGLQTAGLKYDHSAYEYSQATQLAYDILDRMRANRDTATSTSAYQTGLNDPIPAPSVDCSVAGNTCSGNDMALFDINQWKTQLAETLPGGKASVTFSDTATGQRIYTITIQWDDLGWDAAKKALTRSTNYSFQLRSQV